MTLAAAKWNLLYSFEPALHGLLLGGTRVCKNRRHRALAAPKAAQFILDNSNLYQIRPDAESESFSPALHPVIPVYPLGPSAQV